MNARTVSFSIFQAAENIPTSRGRKHCDIHLLQQPAARLVPAELARGSDKRGFNMTPFVWSVMGQDAGQPMKSSSAKKRSEEPGASPDIEPTSPNDRVLDPRHRPN